MVPNVKRHLCLSLGSPFSQRQTTKQPRPNKNHYQTNPVPNKNRLKQTRPNKTRPKQKTARNKSVPTKPGTNKPHYQNIPVPKNTGTDKKTLYDVAAVNLSTWRPEPLIFLFLCMFSLGRPTRPRKSKGKFGPKIRAFGPNFHSDLLVLMERFCLGRFCLYRVLLVPVLFRCPGLSGTVFFGSGFCLVLFFW